MTNKFREIAPTEITDNVFKLIDQDWMLVTAGAPDHFNMMTASWGGLGSLWHELVGFVFVRPQRYTYQFMAPNPINLWRRRRTSRSRSLMKSIAMC